jgi:hypothetical protein
VLLLVVVGEGAALSGADADTVASVRLAVAAWRERRELVEVVAAELDSDVDEADDMVPELLDHAELEDETKDEEGATMRSKASEGLATAEDDGRTGQSVRTRARADEEEVGNAESAAADGGGHCQLTDVSVAVCVASERLCRLDETSCRGARRSR